MPYDFNPKRDVSDNPDENRLIEFGPVFKQLRRLTMDAMRRGDKKSNLAYIKVRDILAAAPAVEAEPIVHGRWEFGELDALGAPVRCSHCGWGIENADPTLWLDYPGHKHCGACGTKMDLEASYEKM